MTTSSGSIARVKLLGLGSEFVQRFPSFTVHLVLVVHEIIEQNSGSLGPECCTVHGPRSTIFCFLSVFIRVIRGLILCLLFSSSEDSP
jgi:hypothetical protein